jgi:hypothetical protein
MKNTVDLFLEHLILLVSKFSTLRNHMQTVLYRINDLLKLLVISSLHNELQLEMKYHVVKPWASNLLATKNGSLLGSLFL